MRGGVDGVGALPPLNPCEGLTGGVLPFPPEAPAPAPPPDPPSPPVLTLGFCVPPPPPPAEVIVVKTEFDPVPPLVIGAGE